MGDDLLELPGARARGREQAVANRAHHLTLDLEIGLQQCVEGRTHRPGERVLHRQHAERGLARDHRARHVAKLPAWQGLDPIPEPDVRRLVAVRTLLALERHPGRLRSLRRSHTPPSNDMKEGPPGGGGPFGNVQAFVGCHNRNGRRPTAPPRVQAWTYARMATGPAVPVRERTDLGADPFPWGSGSLRPSGVRQLMPAVIIRLFDVRALDPVGPGEPGGHYASSSSTAKWSFTRRPAFMPAVQVSSKRGLSTSSGSAPVRPSAKLDGPSSKKASPAKGEIWSSS